MEISEIADKINEIIKSLPTKQDKDPYIWDYNIKIAKKNARIRNDGSNVDITSDEISVVYDYEEETKVKVKKR